MSDNNYDRMSTARLNAIIDGHYQTGDGTIAAASLADILKAMIQHLDERLDEIEEIGRASCRERV